jgi:S-(hydroxymethyl)glutathione dehydrogenase/alcohol dehydrogenase
MFDGSHRLKRGGDEIKQMARIGTFAEQVVCPAEQLVPIKKEMPWPQAALLGCCVPTGVGAVTRCAEVEPGASVMIVGCGGVGLNVVQGARLAGAGAIVAVDLLDNKLEFARKFGATHTVNASKSTSSAASPAAAASTTPSTPSAARPPRCRSSTPCARAAPPSSSAWPP